MTIKSSLPFQGFCIIYDIVITQYTKTKQSTKVYINFYIKVIIRISLTILGIIILLYGRWTVMGRHTPEFKAIDNPAAFSDSLFTKVRSTSKSNHFKIFYIFKIFSTPNVKKGCYV